jgi:hypothetical protein
MIIYTVDMALTVDNSDTVLANLRTLAKDFKGYVADSRTWYDNEQAFASVTLRIPATSLDDALGKIRSLAIRVDSENIASQDVTEEYTDLGARLRNLEAAEKELLAMETEIREKGGKAEDILQVHAQVTEIRGQIEQLKGRMQYLERLSALATIKIEIRPKAAPQPVVQGGRWNPALTFNRAARALVSVTQALVDVAIYLLTLSPIVILPVLVLWGIALLIRRSRKNRKPANVA